ncbi:MAG: hypothetical protein WD468_08270 [Pirellulales bacterium]
MKLRFDWAVVVVVSGTCACGLAQIPFEPAQVPAQAAPVQQQTPQQQADVKWLMKYMLANEGYRFDDVPMMERSFGQMSPTQLHTLREFYEKKHALEMQHAATMIQAQQNQMSAIQAQQLRAAIESRESQSTEIAAAAQRQQQREQAFFLTPTQDAWQGSIANVRLQNMGIVAEKNEEGDLFQIRQIPGLRKDPFGPTPMRGVGYGSWGERRDDLSPSAGAN